jgi:hypothetical protein
VLRSIANILERCGTDDAVLPPTALYNEGWLLRLVLDWFSHRRDIVHPLSFMPGARWYSEALLPSQFLAETRGDARAESFTHADGLIGHFHIRSGTRGEATILPDAKQFVVLEAKLGSRLSSGTKNAPDYDQAARNVACIAHLIGREQLDPNRLECLAFYVIAPQTQIEAGVFSRLVTKESIANKVRARVERYGARHAHWFESVFEPVLTRISLSLLSWEEVLDLPDRSTVRLLHGYYVECLKHNPLRGLDQR